MLCRPFLASTTATSLYSWCLAELPWFKVQYKARGMDINTPRLPLLLLALSSNQHCSLQTGLIVLLHKWYTYVSGRFADILMSDLNTSLQL